MATTKLVDVSAVAEMLGVSRPCVWQMVRRGELPHIRVGPRAIRSHPADIERWIDRRTTTRPRGSQ